MKIISWNVRGLGNPRTCLALKKILQVHKPQLVFLCETKLKNVQVKKECERLMIDSYFAVGIVGRSGGLVLL